MLRTALDRALMLILILLMVGCATTDPKPTTGEATRAKTGAPAADDAEAQAVDAALDQALEQGWKKLHLITECGTEKGWRAVEAFSNGVAIWNQAAQIRLSREQLAEQLRLLRQSDFSSMRELYGGEPPDMEEKSEGSAMQIICRIYLDLDGTTKQVAQRRKGKHNAELAQLAASLLAVCEEPARSAIKIADLAEGLHKLGEGELAPETWHLLLNLRPESTEGGEGFLLRVEGRQASTQPYEASAGLGQKRVLELDPDALTSLVETLVASQLGEVPINLYAESYTDFSVSVLNQRKKIQARQFAGLTPTKHGDHQKRFDQLIGELKALHQKVVAEGKVVDEG